MGLDSVEIVMDVEDHFGISIQDAEAERVRTVGDLVALVRARIFAAQREYCPSLPAFLTLRRTTRALLGDDSLRFRPRDTVASVLGPSQRRALWKRLSEMLGARPRPLRRPTLLRQSLVAISAVLILLAIFSALVIDIRTLPLTITIAIAAMTLLHWLTVPFCSIPPDGWITFGQITTKIVGVAAATKLRHLRTDDEILDELRRLLVNVLGVDETEIIPSARFVEDLGMD
jgi:acyl carrier protein